MPVSRALVVVGFLAAALAADGEATRAIGRPGEALAGSLVVVEEHKGPAQPGRKKGRSEGVQLMAVVRNVSGLPARNVRATLELVDYFGKVLWVKTVGVTPSTIAPGATAVVTTAAPDLPDHHRTRYRFQTR